MNPQPSVVCPVVVVVVVCGLSGSLFFCLVAQIVFDYSLQSPQTTSIRKNLIPMFVCLVFVFFVFVIVPEFVFLFYSRNCPRLFVFGFVVLVFCIPGFSSPRLCGFFSLLRHSFFWQQQPTFSVLLGIYNCLISRFVICRRHSFVLCLTWLEVRPFRSITSRIALFSSFYTKALPD